MTFYYLESHSGQNQEHDGTAEFLQTHFIIYLCYLFKPPKRRKELHNL